MPQGKICCVWDFTVHGDDHKSLIAILKKHCKKWCVQLEKGEETGKLHLQGRCSFKTKQRLTSLKKIHATAHWSPTSNENRDNNFYVTKEETRVDGPWMDEHTEQENYIPRQVREMTTLKPWQQSIVDQADVWDTRTVNVVIDPQGGKGKTSLMTYMMCHKLAKKIPFVNNNKDLMRMAYCVGPSRCYVFDLPRAIDKSRLLGLYAAIEELKSGWMYDDRYTFKQRCIDCPNIWLFTNALPDMNLLSEDRWKLWKIHDEQLVSWWDDTSRPTHHPPHTIPLIAMVSPKIKIIKRGRKFRKMKATVRKNGASGASL